MLIVEESYESKTSFEAETLSITGGFERCDPIKSDRISVESDASSSCHSTRKNQTLVFVIGFVKTKE
jgi:hypothetical protein